jgi:spoIIIJ-associated protein
MSDEKTTLEVIAPSVEEAVEKGLSDLGLTRDAVDVEILDEGKRNLFRFATRQARVRLIVKQSMGASSESQEARSPVKAVEKTAVPPHAAETSEELTADQAVVRDTLVELLAKMGISAKVTVSYADIDPEEKPSYWLTLKVTT